MRLLPLAPSQARRQQPTLTGNDGPPASLITAWQKLSVANRMSRGRHPRLSRSESTHSGSSDPNSTNEKHSDEPRRGWMWHDDDQKKESRMRFDDGPLHDWATLGEAGLRAWATQYVGWATNEMGKPADLSWSLDPAFPLDTFLSLCADWAVFHRDEIVEGPRYDAEFACADYHTPVVSSAGNRSSGMAGIASPARSRAAIGTSWRSSAGIVRRLGALAGGNHRTKDVAHERRSPGNPR